MKNILVTICLFFIALTNTHADEWRKCEVGKSTANDREIAIELGKVKKTISFFKKSNFASITIFADEKTWVTTDLIPTGQGLYGDGKPYLGYADKTNTVIVQEFINGKTMIVGLDGEKLRMTLFATCE
jgi:hypothetical protein